MVIGDSMLNNTEMFSIFLHGLVGMESKVVVLCFLLLVFLNFYFCVVDEATASGNACSEESKRNKNDIRRKCGF